MSFAIFRRSVGVAIRMERHSGASAIRVPELLVRAALADLFEAQGVQEGYDLTRSQGGQGAHSRHP